MLHIHANHGGITIMKIKVLLALIAIVVSFELLAACSDDSSDEDVLISVPANTSAAKGESFDFKTSSCKNNLSKWADGVGEETVDFFINEDGSATVDMKSSMFCNGIYSMIYETRDDTLFATQNYARVVKKLDPATKDSVIVEYEEFRSHCVCQIDLELKIPSEFVGTKYVNFEGDCRSIVYKKRK